MNIGQKIKTLRKSNMLTQEQLGKKIKKSTRMIQKYENNEVTPSIEVLQLLADVFNLTLSSFLDCEYTPESLQEAYEVYEEYLESLNCQSTYVQKLSYFYELLKDLKETDKNFERIDTKIYNTGLDNIKKILEENDLNILLKSLNLMNSITNFLKDPNDKEIQRQLQIILDDFNVPKGKKLKLNLVDSE